MTPKALAAQQVFFRDFLEVPANGSLAGNLDGKPGGDLYLTDSFMELLDVAPRRVPISRHGEGDDGDTAVTRSERPYPLGGLVVMLAPGKDARSVLGLGLGGAGEKALDQGPVSLVAEGCLL